MTKKATSTFDNTRKAFIKFDKSAAKRKKLWDSVNSNADVEAAQKADHDALALVQEAFYEDTSDINSHDHCTRVDESFMRRMANRAPAHPQPSAVDMESRLGGWKK